MLSHVGGDRVELGLDAAGPVDDGLSLLGQAAGAAVDEGRAELLLEAGDVGADVGLHGGEGVGGGAERALLGHGDERLELAEVHRS